MFKTKQKQKQINGLAKPPLIGQIVPATLAQETPQEPSAIELRSISHKLHAYLTRGAYHTLLYATSVIVIRLTNFALLPFFTRHITLAEFGIWDYYQTIFTSGLILCSTLPITGLARFFILHKHDKEAQQTSVATAFFTCSALSFLVFLSITIALVYYRKTLSPFFFTPLQTSHFLPLSTFF